MSESPDRPTVIFGEMVDRHVRQTHRTFVWLLLVQWLVAIGLAALRTPWTWSGSSRAVHPHVFMAVGLGGLLCSLPILLIRLRPTWAPTRHVVAMTQMLWSALMITLLGGRIEAHFHVFGSLAFIAIYRDWRVLVTATLTVAIDHLMRGLFWPDSVYGIANPEWWRFLEHATWVVFEVAVLGVSCVRATREMCDAARREASLEQINDIVRLKVENRTRQLRDNVERYRVLVENTEAIPFEYDAAQRRLLYIAPQAAKLLECEQEDLHSDTFLSVISSHPADRPRVLEAIAAFIRDERSPREPIDYRVITKQDRIAHVRAFFGSHTGSRLRGIILDITRQTQLERELRQAQKLESVGRLAAGVAHEINTPIQFVNDSVEFVRAAINDLVGVVDVQRVAIDAARHGAFSEPISVRVHDAMEHADLPYLVEQLPRALDRALDGTRRVGAIVQSMQAFAQDGRLRTEVDLREAIANTLTVARTEYAAVADIVLVLEPTPLVSCYASDVNQVILDVLVNAAHAIAEVVEGSDRRGTITIGLRQVGAAVVISIGDTGPGIPEDLREHVFEMFFTTKPVGTGTGQGLSHARQVIVDKHHGSLTFDTEVGVGTTFHISLPIAMAPESSPSPFAPQLGSAA